VRRFAAPAARLTGGPVFCLGLAGGLHLISLLEAQKHLVLQQRLGAPAEAMTLRLLDDSSSRSARARSGSSITLSLPGSSGSALATTAMVRADHGMGRFASQRMPLIHCDAAQLGCTGTMSPAARALGASRAPRKSPAKAV
jgi:hypothetical protein